MEEKQKIMGSTQRADSKKKKKVLNMWTFHARPAVTRSYTWEGDRETRQKKKIIIIIMTYVNREDRSTAKPKLSKQRWDGNLVRGPSPPPSPKQKKKNAIHMYIYICGVHQRSTNQHIKKKKNSQKLLVFFPVLQAQDEVSLLSFFFFVKCAPVFNTKKPKS